MPNKALERITESGTFEWPWPTACGLLIVKGATGGGGGGGGALCIQGLNLYGSSGGGGGGGGAATKVKFRKKTYVAAGGNGGSGGNAGGLIDGKPEHGKQGRGCHYGSDGEGGPGAVARPGFDRIVSDGGTGGRGFPGETLLVELSDLSVGDVFDVDIGEGGGGGGGGDGYEKGGSGTKGIGGSVLLVPVVEKWGDG